MNLHRLCLTLIDLQNPWPLTSNISSQSSEQHGAPSGKRQSATEAGSESRQLMTESAVTVQSAAAADDDNDDNDDDDVDIDDIINEAYRPGVGADGIKVEVKEEEEEDDDDDDDDSFSDLYPGE